MEGIDILSGPFAVLVNQKNGVNGTAIVSSPAMSATAEMRRRPMSVREGSAPQACDSLVLACLTILSSFISNSIHKSTLKLKPNCLNSSGIDKCARNWKIKR